MGSKWRLTGREVPSIGSDSVKWIDLSICSSSSTLSSSSSWSAVSEGCGGSCWVKGGDAALVWRIQKTALELFQVSSSQPFPILGLRFNFPHLLSPFAFLSNSNNKSHYLLYAFTVSGLAFLLNLSSNFSSYSSSSVFPSQDLEEVDLEDYGPIISVAAVPGCVALAKSDGSLISFQFGTHPPIVHQLRHDSGIRFWGFMSRGSRMVGAVKDLVISEVQARMLLFVLHSDSTLRVWDLSSRTLMFTHTITNPTLQGAESIKLWVGETHSNTSNIIPFAILHRHTLEVGLEMIRVYSLQCSLVGDRLILSLESSLPNISLEGGCIDVKLTSDKIWILKDSGLVSHNLFHANVAVEEARFYTLQEDFVADQLFQSSEHSSDDLLAITCSIVTSMKDHIFPFVSSIFLRRILHPGVHHNSALRATLLDYNRHYTDSEFQSLTVDGLRKEIISLIEHEDVAEGPVPMFCGWKSFCSRYFHQWCKNNEPYGLFVQSSTGAVGLLRRNSVSAFRSLENVELLIDGPSDELGELGSTGLELFGGDAECEILFQVLRCIIGMSQKLGKTASAVFYESFVGKTIVTFEETVSRLLKILETGYDSSVTALNISHLGADVSREKELSDHKILRKFSIDMLLSLQTLNKKAASWDKVLNIIESYLQFFVPHKIIQHLNAEIVYSVNTSVVVQATSQIAKVMFEAALDVLLFLSYLVNVSGQISMLHDDICRVQLELIPMIQEIVFEWLIILFFSITPSESPSTEDFSSQLSSLQIGDYLEEIPKVKEFLVREFKIKAPGEFKHFLRMKVARSKKGIIVSQRKYVLDLLKETSMFYCKLTDTPMDYTTKVFDRKTKRLVEELIDGKIILSMRAIYQSKLGLGLMDIGTKELLKSITEKQGRKMNSLESSKDIPKFINFFKDQIKMAEVKYPLEHFKTFNEFFIRELKPGSRPIACAEQDEVAVCSADSRLMAFNSVEDSLRFWIKGRKFSIQGLLGRDICSDAFINGTLVIFRLAPQDYHRFHLPVSGTIEKFVDIPGCLYTVNPIAVNSKYCNVFTENQRVVSIISTVHFGKVAFVAIGATMVGSINFLKKEGDFVKKGDEFGYFSFGGSTVICVFEEDAIQIDEDLLTNSARSLETLVSVGMRLGVSTRI